MESARVLPLSASSRRPGLEALRAVATVLVVMLHAGVPYTVAPMPGLTWPVRHTVVSPLVDFLFWGIEAAIMPLFFLLSGYGAATSLASQPERFLATRWRRLGWPLLAAGALLLPIELYIWLIGWAADGQIPWQKLRSLKLESFHENLWGLSHLWYLEYLLLYSGLLWVGHQWVRHRQSPLSATKRPWLVPRAGLFCVATILTLWIAPEVIVGFQHSFFPVPAKFVFSGLFFAAGVVEFHSPSRPFMPSGTAGACCCALLIGLLPLIHRQAAEHLFGMERCALAIGLAGYAILATQAAWQWTMNSQSAVPAALISVARASFWIYLVHHPLVAIWQIGLRSTGWPAILQFACVTLGTLAMSLASYEWFVRPTWLGAFLEGRRSIPATLPIEPPAPHQLPTRRAA